jgi:hypothetical protein
LLFLPRFFFKFFKKKDIILDEEIVKIKDGKISLHNKCFKCSICNQFIKENFHFFKDFISCLKCENKIESYINKNKKVLTPLIQNISKNSDDIYCFICSDIALKKDRIQVLGKYYHKDCFCCSECYLLFEDINDFYEKKNNPVCKICKKKK